MSTFMDEAVHLIKVVFKAKEVEEKIQNILKQFGFVMNSTMDFEERV